MRKRRGRCLCVALACGVLFTACQPQTSASSEAQTTLTNAPLLSSAATTSGVTSLSEPRQNPSAYGAAPWAVGTWRGEGTATLAKVELPGNQGVQLAWVKDKGTKFVGPVKMTVALNTDGTAVGAVTGSLGDLQVVGSWDSGDVLHARLSAHSQTPEAFNGLVTVALADEKPNAPASLRVVSNDGHWVRQATAVLEFTK